MAMRRSPLSLLLAPLTGVALALAGCGGGSTPTSPAAPQFQMTSAQVVVDGQVLNGATIQMGHGGGATRFEARLSVDGTPAAGGTVYCQYDRPAGMGSMHGQGTFTMYDDGTHGDHTPGDGLYCFQDDREQYGCHGDGAAAGEYHYEFWGQHHAYGVTAHQRVTVTVR